MEQLSIITFNKDTTLRQHAVYAVTALVSAITLAREVRTLKKKLEKLEKEHRNNVKLKT